MKSKIFNALIKLSFWIVKFFPLALRVVLGKCVGVLLRIVGFRRSIILKNLDIVFGKGGWPKRMIGQIYQHFGLLFIEMLYLPSIKDGDVMADFTGLENLDAALEKGKGVIMISGHTGNWEMTAGSLASKGYKVNAIVKKLRDIDNKKYT